MKKLAILVTIIVACLLTACTRPESAERVLTQQGYRDVKITGYAWLSCSKDDTFRTAFEATAPNGERIEGTVCEGVFFKGKTVRFD